MSAALRDRDVSQLIVGVAAAAAAAYLYASTTSVVRFQKQCM